MKKRIAVYAASLDPVTNGHLNVIERTSPLYDELIVVVAVDPRKKYLFSAETRASMVRESVAHLPNVTVDVCVGRYVAKYANRVGAQVIVRGLRNFKDMEDEQVLAEENRKICPGVETVWIPCLPELAHVSSSMIKAHVGADPDWQEQVRRSVPMSVFPRLVLERARHHWQVLMAELGNPNGAEAIFEDVIARYAEPHRAYHTLEHIVSMLDEFECVVEGAEDSVAVKLAIWYHDIVYDTAPSDPKVASNEERSVFRFEKDAEILGLSAELVVYVAKLILATRHDSLPTSQDEQILVDLDLAIFGKSRSVFNRYEKGIREEYRHVPERVFCAKRKEILKSFLGRPFIFSFQIFRDLYQSAAEENLRCSIEDL